MNIIQLLFYFTAVFSPQNNMFFVVCAKFSSQNLPILCNLTAFEIWICNLQQALSLYTKIFSVLLQKGGPYLAIYLWGFMFALSIIMMTLYPILIAPLFNKFTPVSTWLLYKCQWTVNFFYYIKKQLIIVGF